MRHLALFLTALAPGLHFVGWSVNTVPLEIVDALDLLKSYYTIVALPSLLLEPISLGRVRSNFQQPRQPSDVREKLYHEQDTVLHVAAAAAMEQFLITVSHQIGIFPMTKTVTFVTQAPHTTLTQ
jgi:hypothetical protein